MSLLQHHNSNTFFFGTLSSLLSYSYIHTSLLETPSFDYTDLSQQSDVFAF